jgi:hypothetical protein
VNQVPTLKQKTLPLSKALLVIFLSTLFISGSATTGWLYYLYVMEEKAEDKEYIINGIVQTGPEKEALKSVYLAEILGLSIDQSTNLYRFDTVEAKNKLEQSPVVKTALVEIQPPNTVYIDYTVRNPIAYLYDFENTAIDAEGFILPISPFFTPKNLPYIYLGDVESLSWGAELENEGMKLSLHLLEICSKEEYRNAFDVERIDVSNAFSSSYGQRQIVIILADRLTESQNGKRRILRLSSRNYLNELNNYLVLRAYLIENEEFHSKEGGRDQATPMIVDLRIPRLAFLK